MQNPLEDKKNRRRAPDEIQSSNKLSRSGIRMTCTKCGGLGHNKRTCKAINPSMETTPTPQTEQGYGVRYFPETGNLLARAPGGRAVQYVSGARAATAAVSRLRKSGSQIPSTSTSTRIEDGSSQSSSAIATTILKLTC
ncbi:MuDR family transposase [Perilla frutescens var. frutescens]|nr:MuDR family transposase [Perilla frutescens var. frutescens]